MKKKKILIFFVVVISVFLVILGWRLIFGPEDTWVCQNGLWVKRGNSSNPAPNEPCNQSPQDRQGIGSDKIIVYDIKAGDQISSPLEITGKARGSWFFEAEFPIRLLNKNNEVIASALAWAGSDWMTENWVDFKATLEFNINEDSEGKIVFEKDNPSDLPKFAESFEIPVKIRKTETMDIKVYFGNSVLDPGALFCEKTYPVTRKIIKTKAIAMKALEELLLGPSEEEKNHGFFTSINDGVKVQKLVIENGVAKADFSSKLEEQVGGSCRIFAIRSQIEETLKQFPSVKKVIISIDDRTEDVLQP